MHWTQKYSAKSLIAGHLLWALALRQQICTSTPFLVISIEGQLNDMADVASRIASDQRMQAKAPPLLSYFNSHFKQESSWEQFHFPQKLLSRVISSLLGKQLTLESWRRLPGLAKNIGKHGYIMQTPSKLTHFSKTQSQSSEKWCLQHSLLGSGKVTMAKEINKSKFKASLTRWRPSARPLNWLDTEAQSTELITNATYKSNEQLKDGDKKIPPAIPQLAVPVTVPLQMAEAAYQFCTAFAKAIADLTLIGFFYLLRVGQYTRPRVVTRNGKQVSATQTKQFRVKDVGFFKDGKVLP